MQIFRCKIGKSKNKKGLKNQNKIKKPVKSNIEKETISPNKCNFYIELFMVNIKVGLHFRKLAYYMFIIILNYILLFFSFILTS